MATKHDDTPETPHEPSQEPKGQDRKSTLAAGTQARLKEKAEREGAEFRQKDEAMFRRATEGVPDQETLDAVLALGGDATRSSPVREQILPDAEPGLTTTSGAYRSPIDPTTAAVPAAEDSDIARSVGGTPTVGSRKHGVPEERWVRLGDAGQDVIDRLNNLPSREDYQKQEAERMKELGPKDNAPAERPAREGLGNRSEGRARPQQ
jgi:hypothetical protein